MRATNASPGRSWWLPCRGRGHTSRVRACRPGRPRRLWGSREAPSAAYKMITARGSPCRPPFGVEYGSRGNRNSFVAANICEHESNNVHPLSAPTSPPGKNQIFVGHGSAATSDTPAISAPTPSRQTIHFRTPHPQYRETEAKKKADI